MTPASERAEKFREKLGPLLTVGARQHFMDDAFVADIAAEIQAAVDEALEAAAKLAESTDWAEGRAIAAAIRAMKGGLK